MSLKPQLTQSEEQSVELFARTKLNEYGKLNDIIGSQIFSILGRNGTVLYYPLEDEDVWGFVEKTEKRDFVCINTSLEYDKQIFVAAHELYHLLHSKNAEELTLAKNLEDETLSQDEIEQEERKANRFAAAFLIDAGLLWQEIAAFNMKAEKLSLGDVLRLANLFMVPYKTMVRRLVELKLIDEEKFSVLMHVSQRELEVQKKRMGLLLPEQSAAISLDSLNETAMTLYEAKWITAEKLEQILDYSKLTLADMGISLPEQRPLTEDEIDALLED